MAMTLITTNDGSGVATSDFTSSIDNTYKLYIFKWYDVNPVTDSANFGVQFNAAGGSGFNETMQTTAFRVMHAEDDGAAEITYEASLDQASGTGYQLLNNDPGNGSDESSAGELYLFNPSNTTYVKHFYSKCSYYHNDDNAMILYVSGYIDTTSAIDEVSFKHASGNMDAVIKMYGVG